MREALFLPCSRSAGRRQARAWPGVAGDACCRHAASSQDGITYQNACLALCQKVKVAKSGSCGGQYQLLSRDGESRACCSHGHAHTHMHCNAAAATCTHDDHHRPPDAATHTTHAVVFEKPQPGAPRITPALMQQYAAEGFRLIGKAQAGEFEPRASYKKGARQQGTQQAGAAQAKMMSVE